MPLPYDSLSPTTCFATRKLVTAYAGQCLRLDTGGGTDFGFTGNDFNRTAMETAVGVGTALLTAWYDQSGNTRNLTSPGVAAIRTAGVTNTLGSKCCVKHPAGTTGASFAVNNSVLMTNNAATVFWVGQFDAADRSNADPSTNAKAWGDDFGIIGASFTATGMAQAWNDDNTTWDIAQSPAALLAVHAVAWRHSGGNIQINVDGTGWVSVASGNTRAMTGTTSLGLTLGASIARHVEFSTFNTALSDAQVDALGRDAMTYYGGVWGVTNDWTAVMRNPDRTPDSTPYDRPRHLRDSRGPY